MQEIDIYILCEKQFIKDTHSRKEDAEEKEAQCIGQTHVGCIC